MEQSANGNSYTRIAREDNIIVGANLIKAYLRVKSWATLYRLIELYGLPCIKRPDGKWMTSVTAIDEWMFIAADADGANRPYLRGTNVRLETALTQIKRRISDRSSYPTRSRHAPGAGGRGEEGDPPGQPRDEDTTL